MIRASSVWLLVALAACGDDGSPPVDAATPDADAAADGSADGAVSNPFDIRADGAAGALVVSTDPLTVRVERPDGTAVVTSAEGAVSLGVAPGGDERYHSPLEDVPRGVRWSPLGAGVERTSDLGGVVSDAEGRHATVEVEAPSPGVFRLHVVLEDSVDDVALMRLHLAADSGAYHGLGERFGHADARGSVVPMQLALGGTASGTNEHHVPVPFFVSTGGYGVFVETREAGAFDLGATDPAEVRATFEGRELDVYFFVDDDPLRVVALYSQHTGLPRLPPRWAFAPMHWRNEWESGAAALADADRIRTEDIPCTTFWIDNPWEASYNDHVFDETRFPDPAGLLSDLGDRGMVPLLWSTPYLDAVDDDGATDNEAERLFVEARDRGLLVLDRSGDPYLSPAAPGATGGLMDFTSGEAIDFWQERLMPLLAMGVRAFKLDYGEDVLVELLGTRPNIHFSDGRTERELHNVYNTLYHQPYRRALDTTAEGGFLLVRASAWGGQTVADIVWPGDLDNDWREGLDGEVGGLPAAVTALISLSASGFPAFGSDTGGYRGGMPEREVLLRWAEHTAFSPILQLGGAGDHHNPWLYDAEAGAIYRGLARAHMDLVPYLRIQALRASADGTPPVRAVPLEYPDDPGARTDPYAYLLGEDILVVPVVTPGATDRAVHLPPGRWMHWFTGELREGPADVTVPAPLGAPPVFVRQGAVVPLLPPDLDTLIDVTDPTLVDPSDRPYLRAWILPAEAREVTTEEGIVIQAERVTDGIDLGVRPDGSGLTDLRMRVELSAADPAITSVTGVSAGGMPVPESPDAATVEGGCDGVCWFADGDALLISVRGPDEVALQVR